MDAPPVQYVTTSDGYSIAYTVCGDGRPFVMVPLPFNHVELYWSEWTWAVPLFEGLAQRFRLIQYDARGQGMSSRGLSDDLTVDSFRLDLEAVVDRLGLERFILFGFGNALGHVAIRYAAAYPERVDALILACSAVETTAWPLALYDALATQDWGVFLRSQILVGVTLEEAQRSERRLRRSFEQRDWLAMIRSFAESDVADHLPRLTMPTLILHPREFDLLKAEEAMKLAARTAEARLVLTPGRSFLADTPHNLKAIDDFLAALPAAPRVVAARPVSKEAVAHGLSEREVEVLRLLAAGKSNAQIAEGLVISQNTVIRHVSNIFAKTGVVNRAQAGAYARDHGLA